jgi:hypothetical protein
VKVRDSLSYLIQELTPPEPDPEFLSIDSLPGGQWAKHYFPQAFTRPFAKYQDEFWEWGDTIEPDIYIRPRVECEPRGVGKSTNGEALVTKLVAQRKKKMIGYVSLEEDKAGKHFDSIKSLLESPRLLADYPHCRPKVQKLKNTAAQWSRDALITDSDAMIVPLSMQGSSRGWKSPTNARFDMFVLDDIDKLGMGLDFVRKLLEMLKGEILAAGDDETLVLVLQNLIYRDSIVSQILDHRADILSDRIFRGPYPILKSYEAEKVDIEGDDNNAKKWVITAGEPYDEAIPVEYAEKLLNKYGKGTFDRECQQDVFKVDDEKDFREWDEVFHVITYSEFRAFFEPYNIPVWNEEKDHPQIPHNWNVGLGLDWGTTVGHPSACAPFARPNKLHPLNDCFFGFTEIILPKFPIQVGEEVPLVSPGRVSLAIKQALAEWNVAESQVKMQLMSHEASAALNTMLIDLPEELKSYFSKWKPKRGSGVPQIQQLLEIDKTKEHAFRQGIQGMPRFFLVVPDEQGKLIPQPNGKFMVAQPKDYKGLARARYEIPNYSQFNVGASKREDDWVDGALGLMNIFGVTSKAPTPRETHEARMEAHGLSHTAIEASEDETEKLQKLQVRMVEERAFVKDQKKGGGRVGTPNFFRRR